MYKLGVLLLISGALCQHQVTQQVSPAADRPIRLEDIERDGLKSAGAGSQAYQQPQQQLYHQPQQQQQITYQQQQIAYQQPHPAQAYHQHSPLQHEIHPQQQYFQLSPAAYHQPQLSYSPQLLGGHPQQLQLQPLLLQQGAQHYNVPIMLIPYPLQQELTLLPKARPLQAQPQLLTKFRPSPQVQYTNPYNSQVYQQKFAAGVKSTPAPALKDSYEQQQQQQQQQQAAQTYNYKLQ